MVLQELTPTTIYLEVDLPDHSDDIFRTLAFATSNFLAVASKDFALSIWCSAEIAIALTKGVNTVVLACDDYVPPSNEEIECLAETWTAEQIGGVAKLNVEIIQIVNACRKFVQLPVLILDRQKNFQDQEEVVFEVLTQCRGIAVIQSGRIGRMSSIRGGSIVLLSDARDAEMRTVCRVLQRLLQKELQAVAEVASADFEEARMQLDHKNSKVKYLVLVLSKGVLSCSSFAKTLVLAVSSQRLEVVPIVC